jgi:SWI/SNF-related matrix-associated actin-dependent regulator of chromatin subfamily A3
MLKREGLTFPLNPFDETPVDFWLQKYSFSKDSVSYFNLLSKETLIDKPKLTQGGILADDMGLGKTLTIISLILSTNTVKKDLFTTLIVCPLSVLDNWRDQLRQHVKRSQIHSYEYHGTNVNRSLSFLTKHEVIITTYDVLLSEYNPDFKSTLAQIKFLRVILDEGHIIRNFSKNTAKACYQLEARHRWFVSGTPIINKIEDLFSILVFLRFLPFNNRAKFSSLKKKVQQEELRKIVQILSVRRTKLATNNGYEFFKFFNSKSSHCQS